MTVWKPKFSKQELVIFKDGCSVQDAEISQPSIVGFGVPDSVSVCLRWAGVILAGLAILGLVLIVSLLA